MYVHNQKRNFTHNNNNIIWEMTALFTVCFATCDLVADSDLSELQSLVDLFLDEQEEEEEIDQNRFLVFLRLSPVPEFLVKGYDFKMLNK